VIVVLSGCTHIKLRHNVLHQAGTIADFHQQQVLDNLAMFAYNHDSLPFFSYPNQSAANVTDQGSFGSTPGFSRPTGGPVGIVGQFLFTTLGFSFTATRSAQEGFTITPVNDPRKLELMRCAYQKAVGNCGFGQMSGTCPDCKTRFNTFYTGEADGDLADKAQGTVTSDCMSTDCWLCVGCKKCMHKCMKKHGHCCPVGHYCGVYVWVPADRRDELTKLTLMILDFATHDSPQRIGKQVVYYIDELGLPTDRNRAVGYVSAQVAVNERNESLLNMPRADEARIMETLEGQRDIVRKQLAEAKAPEERVALIAAEESLDKKIEYLNEQLRIGGLREEFRPVGPVSAAPFSVIPQLDQQIRTLSSPATLGQ
jgi:hypothetical protein